MTSFLDCQRKLQKVSAMTFRSTDTSALRVLYISCVPGDRAPLDPQVTEWGACRVVRTTEEIAHHLATRKFDCVVALFDPASQQSAAQLESVCECAMDYFVPVASMSTFNPPWIHYLMRHFDVARHFAELPTERELRALVEPHPVRSILEDSIN